MFLEYLLAFDKILGSFFKNFAIFTLENEEKTYLPNYHFHSRAKFFLFIVELFLTVLKSVVKFDLVVELFAEHSLLLYCIRASNKGNYL